MVRIPFFFSVAGYDFQQQLGRLETAYSASVEALTVDVERTKFLVGASPDDPKIVWKLWKPTDIASRDEDFDEERYHEMLLADALDSLRHLQHAFIVLLFHFWERHSIRWAGIQKYDLDLVVAYPTSQGIVPNYRALEELRHLANTIKHNSPALYRSNPDFFGPVSGGFGGSNLDYSRALITSDKMIRDLIVVLRCSGPTAMPRRD